MKLKRSHWGAMTSLISGGAILLAAGPAVAQQQQRSASAQALLEEVVVTARRREESLEDLPLSIAAISADAMQAQGITNTQQLGEFIPNLTLKESDRANNTRVVIRGIGGGHPDPVFVFGTGMYIDGHYIPNSLGGYMSTLDIERVEVLRGPQGTLFGKNTTGGAVNIITTKPGPDFEASALARFGEFGQRDTRGMVNVPLNDKLFARFSAAHEQSDGFYYNRYLDQMTNGRDTTAVTGTLRWEPSDNWTIDSTVSTNTQRDDNLGGNCTVRPDATWDVNGVTRTGGGWGGAYINNKDTSLTTGHLYLMPVQDAGGATVGYINPDGSTFAGSNPLGTAYNAANVPSRFDYNAIRAEGILTNGTTIPLNSAFDLRKGHIDRQVDPALNPTGYRPGPGNSRYDAYNDSCDTSTAAGPFVTSQEKDTFSNIDQEAAFVVATWNSDGALGALDSAQVKITSSYRHSEYRYLQDRDFTELAVDAIGSLGNGSQSNETQNFEAVFEADVSDRFRFTVGANRFKENAINGTDACWHIFQDANPDELAVKADPAAANTVTCSPNRGLFFELLPWPRDRGGAAQPFNNTEQVVNESTAAFGHITYDLSDKWTLDVGARYTNDKRRFFNAEFWVPEGSDPEIATYGATGCDWRTNPDALCPAGNPLVITGPNLVEEGFWNNGNRTWNETTPMVSLTRNMDNGIWYALYSEGFLSGGFNTEWNPCLPDAYKSYDPEHVKNTEFGLKRSIFDGNGQWNADIFYMDYTDKQDSTNFNDTSGECGAGGNFGVVTNVSSMSISGFESEFRMVPWQGGFFSIDVGYLDVKYKDYVIPNFVGGVQQGQTDNSSVTVSDLSPDWTANLSLEHTINLANGGTVTPMIGGYYASGYEYLGSRDLSAPHSYCYQDAYWKWRARLTYDPPAGDYQIALYGNNITDETILQACQDGRANTYRYRYEAPEAWGVEFTARFGNSN